MMRSVSLVVRRHAHSTYRKRIHQGVKPACPASWNRSLTFVCMCVREAGAGYRLAATMVQRVLIGLGDAWHPLAQLAAQLCQQRCCALVRL